MKHRVYAAIVYAVKTGKLIEPFNKQNFQKACPGYGDGTYNAFLHKHRESNPGGNSELFKKVGPGMFRCSRPFKYGL